MTHTMQFWLTFGPMLVAGIAALVADAVSKRASAARIAAIGLLAGGAVGLYGGWTLESQSVYSTFFVGAIFSTAPGVIGVLSGLTVLGASSTLAEKRNGGALAALMTLTAVAAGLTATAIDLLALLLAIETAALASYALVSASRNRLGDEAAMKYYLQGAVSTGLLVAGVAVLVGAYALDGSYAALAGALSANPPAGGSPALFGLLLVVTALAFKTGAAPFHSWAPDAYEHAPAPAAAFMAGPLKLGFLIATMTLVVSTAPAGRSQAALLGLLGVDVLPIVGVIGALSVIVGSLAALRQRSYARMLGYAGVAQVGYGFIAIAAVSPIAAAVFSVTYAVAACGAFMAAVAFARVRPGWDGTIDGLAGVGRSVPVVGVSATLLMASLAGLPPLVGFWGKFQVFVAAIGVAQQFPRAGSLSLGIVYAVFALVGIAGSVVSLAYYGRVVRTLFAPEPPHVADVVEPSTADAAARLPQGERVHDPLLVGVLVAIALIVLFAGVAPLLLGITVPQDGFLLR